MSRIQVIYQGSEKSGCHLKALNTSEPKTCSDDGETVLVAVWWLTTSVQTRQNQTADEGN